MFGLARQVGLQVLVGVSVPGVPRPTPRRIELCVFCERPLDENCVYFGDDLVHYECAVNESGEAD